jgi:uncharacterized protein (DUF924 family)
MTHGMQSKSENAEPAWVDDVLHFWFQQLSEAQWWEQDDAVDAQIRSLPCAARAPGGESG